MLRIIVAAPGSLAGRYPEGNTGRTRAGLMTPMPVPTDLAYEIARTDSVQAGVVTVDVDPGVVLDFDTADIEALGPWLDWAYATAKAA
mgnify:CR=1 FL=1